MPTASNPDSPYLAAQVESILGGRVPGTPSTAGKPTPQPADFGFPAPPSVSARPTGRPPATVAPGPFTMPSASAPAAPTPSAAGPGNPLVGQQPQGAQQPAQRTEGAAPQPASPTPAEATAEATQRYREAVVATRSRLGPIPRVFRHPLLPELEVVPGKPNLNPFTGIWTAD